MTDIPNFTRRVVVIEDDALLRNLLATQLRQWGFHAWEAADAEQAVLVCRARDPDAVILDADLGPGMDGFQLAEALIRRMPHLAVVFLTRYPDARASISRLSGALRGAAYLNKNAVGGSRELLDAVRAALTDRGAAFRHDEQMTRPLASLTKSQLSVLRLIYEGKTNQQIALLRGTTLSATENLVNRVFKALNLTGEELNCRVLAARMYAEHYGARPRPPAV